jgi:hypothetical protein
MSPIPPSEKTLAARLAAETSWANTPNRTSRTAPARQALWQKFLDQVEGDEVRAHHLWKAHFTRLALKSAQARRKAREQVTAAQHAEAAMRALGASTESGGDPDVA